MITFAVGGFFIVSNWSIEWIYVKWLWRYRRNEQYGRLEWCLNGTLQLQRLAHEELGPGTWTDCDTEVPITDARETLATLDLADLKHPKLAPLTQVVAMVNVNASQAPLVAGSPASSLTSLQYSASYSEEHMETASLNGQVQRHNLFPTGPTNGHHNHDSTDTETAPSATLPSPFTLPAPLRGYSTT